VAGLFGGIQRRNRPGNRVGAGGIIGRLGQDCAIQEQQKEGRRETKKGHFTS
jgi:hypothetical protein